MRLWSARNTAVRWEEAYNRRYQMGREWTPERQAVHQKIMEADGDSEKINSVIGNDSWTQFHCSECNRYKPVGVEFDNWDGGIVVVCIDCLRQAVTLTDQTESAIGGRSDDI